MKSFLKEHTHEGVVQSMAEPNPSGPGPLRRGGVGRVRTTNESGDVTTSSEQIRTGGVRGAGSGAPGALGVLAALPGGWVASPLKQAAKLEDVSSGQHAQHVI